MGRRSKLTSDQAAAAYAAIASKTKNAVQLSAELGVCEGTVWNTVRAYARKHNLPMRERGAPRSILFTSPLAPSLAYIQTEKGEIITVDRDKAEMLAKHSWHLTGDGYAASRIGEGIVRMHRLLLGVPDGADVDHVSRVRTDNRLANLRVATKQQNLMNREKYGNAAAKGVRRTRSGRFQVQIRDNGRYACLGTYDTVEEAAAVYDTRAHQLHGEYAFLTDPSRLGATPRTEKRMRRVTQDERAAKMPRYIGVYARKGRWEARALIAGRNAYIGLYDTPEEAAKARDAAVRAREQAVTWRTKFNFDENGERVIPF